MTNRVLRNGVKLIRKYGGRVHSSRDPLKDFYISPQNFAS